VSEFNHGRFHRFFPHAYIYTTSIRACLRACVHSFYVVRTNVEAQGGLRSGRRAWFSGAEKCAMAQSEPLFQPSASARLNHICTPNSYTPGNREAEGKGWLSFDSVFKRPALRGKTLRFRYRLLDLDTVVSCRLRSTEKDVRRTEQR